MNNSQANAERATKAHQAAIKRAQMRARKSRSRKRVGVTSAALFFAVFSLISYRMHLGLDPVIGNNSTTSINAATSVRDDADFEHEADDDFDDSDGWDESDESDDWDESDDGDDDFGSADQSNQQTTTTPAPASSTPASPAPTSPAQTNPAPSTRAS